MCVCVPERELKHCILPIWPSAFDEEKNWPRFCLDKNSKTCIYCFIVFFLFGNSLLTMMIFFVFTAAKITLGWKHLESN